MGKMKDLAIDSLDGLAYDKSGEDIFFDTKEQDRKMVEMIVLLYSNFNDPIAFADKKVIDKVVDWLYTPNPMLGDVKPLHMLEMGRTDKLLQFIKDSMEGNTP